MLANVAEWSNDLKGSHMVHLPRQGFGTCESRLNEVRQIDAKLSLCKSLDSDIVRRSHVSLRDAYNHVHKSFTAIQVLSANYTAGQ